MNKVLSFFVSVSIIIGSFVLFTSCNNEVSHYTIAISDVSTSMHQVGMPLVNLLEQELNVKFDVVDTSRGSVENIRMISEGSIDFAIALTTTGNEELKNTEYDNICTVLPLYNQN